MFEKAKELRKEIEAEEIEASPKEAEAIKAKWAQWEKDAAAEVPQLEAMTAANEKAVAAERAKKAAELAASQA